MLRYLLKSVASASLLATAATPGFAQTAQPINVPQQSLIAALSELSSETGVSVVANRTVVDGISSRAVTGLMTPQDALRTLLTGTGLTYRSISGDRLVVEPLRDSGPVVSQNEDFEPSFDLGTIILRGELQERTLQDSPTSAVVELGETLESRGDLDIFTIVDRTPNVGAVFGSLGFNIRGVDNRGPGGAGLLITTQVDGVALPTSRSTFFGPYSLWDLEQVEILRGPQSTQQGRNALAGAVIFRSKDPTFEEELRMRAEFGSRDFRRFALSYNTPLVQDKLAFRFSAERHESDGVVFNTTLGVPAFPESLETYRAKLLWTPTDRFEAILSYTNSTGQGAQTSFLGLTPDSPPVVRFAQQQRNQNDNSFWGLRLNYELTDVLTIESETDFLIADTSSFSSQDGAGPFDTTLAGDARRYVWEQDLRLRFDSDSVRGVAGLFYTNIDGNSVSVPTLFVGTTPIPIPTFSDSRTENYALYGEIDLRADRWLPGLFFTLGARYDYEERDVTTVSLVGTTRTNPDYSAFLPKVGVTYEFSESQRLSFTIQQGYRAGGASFLRDGTTNEFDAEFSTNYELAYRGSFRDDRLSVSANAYFTDWVDQQVFVDAGRFDAFGTIFETRNAGSSQYYGLELSVEARPTPELMVFGSLGYSQTEFLDFPFNNSVPPNLAGDEFRNAPDLSLAFGYSYAFQNGLTVAMDGNYRSDSFTSIPNDPVQKSQSRWLFNAHMTYDMDQVRVGAYVRNIFDNRYAERREGQATLPAGQIRRQTIGEPRTIGFFVERVF